jgi:hypothetical protein
MASITHDSIGGSLAAWILPGDSKLASRSNYGGPHDAWRLLTGRDDGAPDNEAMRRGRILEGAVVRWVAKYGPELRLRPIGGHGQWVPVSIGSHWGDDLIQHPEHPCLHARDDRPLWMAGERVGSLEVKTFDNTHRALDTGAYRAQAEHYACVLADAHGLSAWTSYLAVMVASTADFAALVSVADSFDGLAANVDDFMADVIENHPRATVLVERVETDELRYRENELPYLVKWFEDYVTADAPPPVDGSRAARATILDSLNGLPEDAAATVNSHPELVNKASALLDKRDTIKTALTDAEGRLAEAASVVKQLKDQYSRATSELMSAAVQAGVRFVTVPGVCTVTVRGRRGNAKFDKASFVRENQAVYEKYRQDGAPYVYMTVKGV